VGFPEQALSDIAASHILSVQSPTCAIMPPLTFARKTFL
jgi:hypothetical protein